ncbi:MAG: homocysteine S-methyltransferase [Actinomycetales bacterium]|nr:homocysteine S-methyltransferase [Actinomycetales bacterium]
MPSLADALHAGPVLLDGGLGTLLADRGHDLSSDLWSARLLLDGPAAIREAHLAYLRAGARVLITSSYQVSADGLAALGRADETERVLAASVRLAREARDAFAAETPAAETADPVWIAASVGPYGATLGDGSEYTGRYGLDVAALRAWHRPRLRAIAGSGPDVLAIETIPSLAEVEALAAELAGLGVPAWLSVTIENGALRTGEPLREAVAIADASPEIVAVGVNCCAPGEVAGALEVARAATTKPLVAYPNSGETWDGANRCWRGSAELAESDVAAWLAAGARLVGGCCRIGPEQIAAMAAMMGR